MLEGRKHAQLLLQMGDPLINHICLDDDCVVACRVSNVLLLDPTGHAGIQSYPEIIAASAGAEGRRR